MTWPTVPLRRMFRLVNGGTPIADDAFWGGDVPWATPVDLGPQFGTIRETNRTLTRVGATTGSQVVPAGSLILSTRAPIGYVARVGREMAFNQGCRALVPTTALDARFFGYLLSASTDHLQARGQGSTFIELSSDALASFEVTCPPVDKQRRIADFLDAEISRIDQIVALRERQVLHTVERMNAAILDAVRGVAEHGPRHESRVLWLGDLPASWAVMSVFAQFEVDLGKMLSPDRVIGKHQRPYLRNSNVQWDRIETNDLLVMNFPPRERDRYRVREGDMLVCEGGQPGRAAIWDGRVPEIYYQKALHRVRSRGRSSVRWLFYCLRAATTMNVFAAEGNATTIAHLTGEQLKSHRFPFPPREDQDRITVGLDREGAHVSQFIGAVERQGRTLAERRQAVITAAVTGQLDVTTAGRATVDLN